MTNLKKLRLSKGMTQVQLAVRLGVTPEHISLIESGNRFPSWNLQKRLEKFFGIPASELLAEADDATERSEQDGGKRLGTAN